MRHPHIVNFHHVFEDSQNVYMILELCENRTFVDLMKKKKRLSEAEARFYARQLIDAISYMHKKRVIHRDLKLGNLFFNSQMDIKLGDFGLATVLADDEERRKTICGTPNYIAPEILFDRKNGHSYEVDLWSLGVILYTVLVGKPPFQTKDVQEIYRKIKQNDYMFPSSVALSGHVQDLIKSLLTTDPSARPSVDDLYQHPWFGNNIPREISPAKCILAIHSPKLASPAVLSARKPMNVLTPVKVPSSNIMVPPLSIKKIAAVDRVVKHSLVESMKQVKLVESPAVVASKPVIVAVTPAAKVKSANNGLSPVQVSPKLPIPGRKSMLETMYLNLKKGLLGAKSSSIPCELIVLGDVAVSPKVFISKWIDYSNKYGLGYQLTNGCVGVYFNDSTSIVLSAAQTNFEYLEYAKGTEKTVMNRQGHRMDNFPEAMQKKVTLLKYFKSYMQDNLSKASQHCFVDTTKNTNLNFLVKFMRTKHAVMFRLTNNIVQINFFDHTKLILSADGLVLTFIDRERKLTTYSLYDVLKERKTDIISRLKYTRDILESLTVVREPGAAALNDVKTPYKK
eukprot:Partr_v1_DN26925_c0_g1_i2_m7078 putative Polo-like kinase